MCENQSGNPPLRMPYENVYTIGKGDETYRRPVRGMKAFVVHGVACRRPINDTIQDLKRAGMRGVLGARWVLGENRRMNKTTSSVVVFLEKEISFVI